MRFCLDFGLWVFRGQQAAFGLWSLGRTCGAFGLWLRQGLFLASFISLFGIRYSSFDILLVERVDSLASFAS